MSIKNHYVLYGNANNDNGKFIKGLIHTEMSIRSLLTSLQTRMTLFQHLRNWSCYSCSYNEWRLRRLSVISTIKIPQNVHFGFLRCMSNTFGSHVIFGVCVCVCVSVSVSVCVCVVCVCVCVCVCVWETHWKSTLSFLGVFMEYLFLIRTIFVDQVYSHEGS